MKYLIPFYFGYIFSRIFVLWYILDISLYFEVVKTNVELILSYDDGWKLLEWIRIVLLLQFLEILILLVEELIGYFVGSKKYLYCFMGVSFQSKMF